MAGSRSFYKEEVDKRGSSREVQLISSVESVYLLIIYVDLLCHDDSCNTQF